MPAHEQHRSLSRKLQGHYGYYGIRSNYRLLEQVYEKTLMAWRKWLGARCSKGYLSFDVFNRFIERYQSETAHRSCDIACMLGV